MLTIDTEAENLLLKELKPDEKFIWTGGPRAGIIFSWMDAIYIPISIAFLIIGLNDIEIDVHPFLICYEVSWCVIGFWLLVGRFLWDKRLRRTTVYGLTDKRIIISSGVFTIQIVSISIDSLTDVSKWERPGGWGTIVLMNKDIVTLWGRPLRGQSVPELQFINNVKEVYDEITQFQNPQT